MNKETYVIEVTPEEFSAMNALVLKMREEKAHEELVQKCKHAISSQIADSISTIGLAETKTIVRILARELRELSDEEESKKEFDF